MRVATALAASLAVAVPAKADDGCHSRKCRARVAHRQCSQTNPRACVMHVIWHQRIHGWRRGWLLRIPGCESTWNPWARSAGGHIGLFQFAPSTFAGTPYGRHSIWSARWQAYAAAWMIAPAQGRSGEWACR